MVADPDQANHTRRGRPSCRQTAAEAAVAAASACQAFRGPKLHLVLFPAAYLSQCWAFPHHLCPHSISALLGRGHMCKMLHYYSDPARNRYTASPCSCLCLPCHRLQHLGPSTHLVPTFHHNHHNHHSHQDRRAYKLKALPGHRRHLILLALLYYCSCHRSFRSLQRHRRRRCHPLLTDDRPWKADHPGTACCHHPCRAPCLAPAIHQTADPGQTQPDPATCQGTEPDCAHPVVRPCRLVAKTSVCCRPSHSACAGPALSTVSCPWKDLHMALHRTQDAGPC
mmetsp:Transcript_11624/g.27103  ORF Transcript_11624/g.27103 Transcript_11624/m.27103 type:complete len:282 (+) Transcript_11624:648-1493(+)